MTAMDLPAGLSLQAVAFPMPEEGAPGHLHRRALAEHGSLAPTPGDEARQDVQTLRLEELRGGQAGTLFAGAALLVATALLLAVVIPWFSPMERRNR